MLPEEKRKELDIIIQEMVGNKESDFNIRFVVDDFKAKYDQPVPEERLTIADKAEKVGRGLSKVFGGEKVGEALGQYAARFTEGGRKLRETDPELAKKALAVTVPRKEIAADVANIGLTVAGLSGVGTAGSFAARVLKTAGLGAGLAGTQAIKEGGGIKETGKTAAIGGAIGAAIPAVGAGLRALGRQVELLPERFVNSALSRSKAQVLQDISKDKVDDLANYVVSNKPVGSANKLVNDSIDNIKSIDSEITKQLSSAVRASGKKVTIGRDSILDSVMKTPEAEGALLKRVDVRNIVEKLAPQSKKLLQKPSLTLEESNKLRSLVDRTLGDRGFLSSQLSSDKAVLRNFAHTLREEVKNKAPEGVRGLFKNYSFEIRFRDGLLEKIAKKQGNQVLSFGDFIGGGLGGIFGGGIPGAVAGVATRRAIESVPFKLSVAKLTNALTKAEPFIQSLAPSQQTELLRIFSEVLSPEEEVAPVSEE